MNDKLIIKDNNLPFNKITDINSLYGRLSLLIKEVNDSNDDIKKITDQGFLGRFVSNINGKTSRALAKGQSLQSQLQEAQIALAFVNLKLVAQLKNQQDLIERQQRRLNNANESLEKQQQKIYQTTKNVEEQQKTILNLLNITSEQEEQIREVVQTAEYLNKLERDINDKFIDMHSLIENANKDYHKLFNDVMNNEITSLGAKITDNSNLMDESLKSLNERISDSEKNSYSRSQVNYILILLALILSAVAFFT